MKSLVVRPSVLSLAVLAAFGSMLMIGCGAKGPKRVPAIGSVTLDGQPLNAGTLYFNPDSSKGNDAKVSCSSPVRDGKFKMYTSAILGSESGPGAPPGWYRVTLRCNLPGAPPVFPGQPVVEVDPKFLDAAKTPLSVELVDSPQGGSFELVLTK